MTPNRLIQVAQLSGSAGTVVRVNFTQKRITEREDLKTIGRELLALIEPGQAKNVLLNFANVDLMASPGLNELIVFRRNLLDAGGKLRLCGLNIVLREAFKATQLDKMFELFPDERAALQGF